MNTGVVCKTLCETACGWLGGQQRTGDSAAGFLQHPLMLHKSVGQRILTTGYKGSHGETVVRMSHGTPYLA